MSYFNILIGGAAGQGIDTLSNIIEKTLHKMGYHLLSNKDYESRVRGGHNFTQIRFSASPVHSHADGLDLIIALNGETAEIHKGRLNQGGVILCDETAGIDSETLLPMPMNRIAKELGNKMASNTVALGVVCRLLGIGLDIAQDVVGAVFKKEQTAINLQALNEGYKLTEPRFTIESPEPQVRMLIQSNHAIALGALAGGVLFYSGYPMTPSSSILTYLASKMPESDIVVEQAEDEIAAIQMAMGASYAGVRSMTATSGGGFALMVEALSLAGMTETPIVIAEAQRPGPATGLPTRTEQGDLLFVLNAGHGEFPRMVIAVRNPEDAFYQTVRALNIADEFQMPVVLLTDQYLADTNRTVEMFDTSKVRIERHLSELKDGVGNDRYQRYKLTESGISPRVIPGKFENQTVLIDSDEHDEYGHIIEDGETRRRMVEKRLKKFDLLRERLIEPAYYGVERPDVLLLGWGSTEGALLETIETLNGQGASLGALVFGDIWPLPVEKLESYAKNAKKVVNVEQNATGQLARLIRQETGISVDFSILKYDGRQISADEVVSRLKEEVL